MTEEVSNKRKFEGEEGDEIKRLRLENKALAEKAEHLERRLANLTEFATKYGKATRKMCNKVAIELNEFRGFVDTERGELKNKQDAARFAEDFYVNLHDKHPVLNELPRRYTKKEYEKERVIDTLKKMGFLKVGTFQGTTTTYDSVVQRIRNHIPHGREYNDECRKEFFKLYFNVK
jgi:hypothetical protein